MFIFTGTKSKIAGILNGLPLLAGGSDALIIKILGFLWRVKVKVLIPERDLEMGRMQKAEFNSFQVERVLDGDECSPFFSQSGAGVRIHSQHGAAVFQLVLSGPSENSFFLLETEKFNDEGPWFPRAGITWSGAKGAVGSLYLRGAAENIGAGYRH